MASSQTGGRMMLFLIVLCVVIIYRASMSQSPYRAYIKVDFSIEKSIEKLATDAQNAMLGASNSRVEVKDGSILDSFFSEGSNDDDEDKFDNYYTKEDEKTTAILTEKLLLPKNKMNTIITSSQEVDAEIGEDTEEVQSMTGKEYLEKLEANEDAVLAALIKNSHQEKPANKPKEPQSQQPKKEPPKPNTSFERRADGVLEKYSYVQYRACCGLGHRLARMAKAADLARRLHFGLKGYWRTCGRTEIFQYLFGAEQPVEELRQINQTGTLVVAANEVAGYEKISRRMAYQNSSKPCICEQDEIESDYHFFNSLMSRFNRHSDVLNFTARHRFQDHTVIGMHVRFGNGEKGHFTRNGRTFGNQAEFVAKVSNQLIEISQSFDQAKHGPPLVFMATDTAPMIDMFRKELAGKMQVVDLPQLRPTAGQGVFFGEHTKFIKQDSDEQCLLGWEQAMMDMSLLAKSDIVFAPLYSSFTQTIPLSVVLGKDKSQRKVQNAYCENDKELNMYCYDTHYNWCCNSKAAMNNDVLKAFSWNWKNKPIEISKLKHAFF